MHKLTSSMARWYRFALLIECISENNLRSIGNVDCILIKSL